MLAVMLMLAFAIACQSPMVDGKGKIADALLEDLDTICWCLGFQKKGSPKLRGCLKAGKGVLKKCDGRGEAANCKAKVMSVARACNGHCYEAICREALRGAEAIIVTAMRHGSKGHRK